MTEEKKKQTVKVSGDDVKAFSKLINDHLFYLYENAPDGGGGDIAKYLVMAQALGMSIAAACISVSQDFGEEAPIFQAKLITQFRIGWELLQAQHGK